MAKKKINSDEFEGGIDSLFSMVQSIDNSAEIIADSYYSNIQEWIPSGNYILNACMSGDLFKAIPSGKIITYCGPSGCLPKNEKIEIYIIKGKNRSHDIYIED